MGNITIKNREVIGKPAERMLLLPSFSGWILVLSYFQIIVGGGELMTSHMMTASSPSLNSWGDGAFWKVSFSVEKNNNWICFMHLQIIRHCPPQIKRHTKHKDSIRCPYGVLSTIAQSNNRAWKTTTEFFVHGGEPSDLINNTDWYSHDIERIQCIPNTTHNMFWNAPVSWNTINE